MSLKDNCSTRINSKHLTDPSNYKKCEKTNGIARSYNIIPTWHRHAEVLSPISILFKAEGVQPRRTTVIGIDGALGKMNLTSSNLDRRRQFSARDTQPAPLSPRPWAMITVAVCFFTAGIMRDVGEEGGILKGSFGGCMVFNLSASR